MPEYVNNRWVLKLDGRVQRCGASGVDVGRIGTPFEKKLDHFHAP